MDIQAVIFDLGGVLVRTEDYEPRQRLAARLGVSLEALEELVFDGASGRRAQLGEIDVQEHWRRVSEALGISDQELVQFQDDFWAGDELDLELVDLIRSLHGRYRTGLLSNAFSDLRQVITQHWGIADAFDVMVISSEVGMTKPDPCIYRLALHELGAAPHQAVFIDDFLENVHGAQQAGLHAIHFRSTDQARAELNRLLDSQPDQTREQ